MMYISPYSTLFAKLTLTRSQGYKDLKHSQISDDLQTTQLSIHINSFEFAAITQEADPLLQHKWLSDGYTVSNLHLLTTATRNKYSISNPLTK